MTELSLTAIIRGVLSDTRLIAVCTAVLFYLNFVFYVARYKKKKKSVQKKQLIKIKASAAPAPAAPADADSGGNTAEE